MTCLDSLGLPTVLLSDLDPVQDVAEQATPTTTPPDGAAGDGEEGGGSGFMDFLPFIAIGAVFWFLLIAPERRNRKKREQMLTELSKGDEVMTNGGIYGTIAKIDGDVITLKVAENVRLRFARAAIQMPSVEAEAAKGAREKDQKEDGKDAKNPTDLANDEA